MHKFSGIVKQQLDYWRYQVAHYGPDHPRYRPSKIAKYEHLIREFSALADYLDSLPDQESVENVAPTAPSFYRRPTTRLAQVSHAQFEEPAAAEELLDVPDELADLPPELLKELSDGVKGETDPLIKIINGRGGTATLDEILIDLWRKYKEIGKRPIVSNKLYRLSRRGLCWAVPGKKGIYTTTKPASDAPAPADDEQGSGTPETPPSEPAPNSSQETKAPTPRATGEIKRRKLGSELFASTATIPPHNPLKLKF